MTDTTIDRTPPPVHLRIGAEKIATGEAGVHGHVNPAPVRSTRRSRWPGPPTSIARSRSRTRRSSPGVAPRPPSAVGCCSGSPTSSRSNADDFDRLGCARQRHPADDRRANFAGESIEWTRYYAGWADKIDSDVTSSLTDDGELGYTLRPAVRRHRDHHHLERPADLAGDEDPGRARRRQHRRGQAVGADAVLRRAVRGPRRARPGFPPGVVNILPGDAGGRRGARDRTRWSQKVTFTGGPVTAQQDPRGVRRAHEAGRSSSSAASPPTSSSRTPTSTSPAFHGTIMSVRRAVRPGLRVPDADARARRRLRRGGRPRHGASPKCITLGDPFDPATMAGPVVNQAAVDRILGMIERAKADGARLVVGGAPPGR